MNERKNKRKKTITYKLYSVVRSWGLVVFHVRASIFCCCRYKCHYFFVWWQTTFVRSICHLRHLPSVKMYENNMMTVIHIREDSFFTSITQFSRNCTLNTSGNIVKKKKSFHSSGIFCDYYPYWLQHEIQITVIIPLRVKYKCWNSRQECIMSVWETNYPV